MSVTMVNKIGAYSLVHRLGAGGMAEVWLARREGVAGANKTVALKLLAPQLAEGESYQRMFMTEARLAMMLSHSNLVQVFDVGQAEGRWFMVMEWVDGLDLSKLLKQLRAAGETMPLDVVAYVIEQMLRGLIYAHGLDEGGTREAIVHRDISPHNVLISVSGEVKISDFGIARMASEETTGLHVRGKMRYMPPEQALGKSRAPTVDLFAVGAVMHEALSGEGFRAGIDPERLFHVVVHGDPPALERDDIPAELRAVCEGLLQPSRQDRYATAEQALAALERWPGLRNASTELAGLVRRFSGVDAPRSGLSLESDTRQVVHSDVRTKDRSKPASRRDSDDEPTSVSAVSAISVLESRSASKSVPVPMRGPSVISIAASSMLITLLGMGLGISWAFGGESLDDAGVVAAPRELEVKVGASRVVDSPPEPSSSPSSSSPPIEPSQIEPSQIESSVEAEPAASVSTEPEPRTRKRPVALARSVRVELTPHEYHYAQVRIGRSTPIDVDGKVSIRLAPGTHSVSIREPPSEVWIAAGTIELAADRHYRIDLRRSGKLAPKLLE
ncbi:serine/threonine-protein kinase [Nannocystaceae bacterium ST9]